MDTERQKSFEDFERKNGYFTIASPRGKKPFLLRFQRLLASVISLLGFSLFNGLYHLTSYSYRTDFNVLGLDVIVNDGVIAQALQNLPKSNRYIILLSYFLELSDREIGKKLDMVRSTVQYRRTSTLRELKNLLRRKMLMNSKCQPKSLVPYPFFVLAAGGDVDAINAVLNNRAPRLFSAVLQT